jgi:hypothetical protein
LTSGGVPLHKNALYSNHRNFRIQHYTDTLRNSSRPVLVPSNYFQFRSLKKCLYEKRFPSDNELKDAFLFAIKLYSILWESSL